MAKLAKRERKCCFFRISRLDVSAQTLFFFHPDQGFGLLISVLLIIECVELKVTTRLSSGIQRSVRITEIAGAFAS